MEDTTEDKSSDSVLLAACVHFEVLRKLHR